MKKMIQMIFKLNIVKGLGILILLLAAEISLAQQDPMYTQYNFNTQVINPAYAGTWDNLGFMVLGRHQWIGLGGAPKTYTFSMQAPIRSKNVALGLNIVSDKLGFVNSTFFSGDYSYRLRVSEESFLRLGLKGGVSNYFLDFSDYQGYPGDPSDPLYMRDVEVKYMPNFGVGAFLYSEDYYIGLSVPKILENKFDPNSSRAYATWHEFRNMFLMAGIVFDLSNDIKFKPTFLTKATMGAPVEFDFTANFLLREQVWLGAMYRTGDAFGFIAQWIFDRHLRLGYGVDFTTSKLRRHHYGTHELMVSYELGALRRKWETPRRF